MLYTKIMLSFLIVAQIVLLNGCATTKPESPLTQSPTESIFFDSGLFDADLSSKLYQNPEKFTIKPAAGVNVNKMPERIDKWLSKIKQENGSVQLKEYSPNSTKDIGLLIDMAVTLFDLAKDAALYHPATQYDAIVEYDKASGDVKQIMLFKKAQ